MRQEEHHDSRARSGIIEPRENSVPDPSEIRSNEDFNRAFFSTQEGVNRFRKQFGPNGLQKARAMYPDVNRGVYSLSISVKSLGLGIKRHLNLSVTNQYSSQPYPLRIL